MGDGAEDGVPAAECVGPGWGFVAFAGSAGEEDIVEIGVIDVEFMGTDSYNWAGYCEQV